MDEHGKISGGAPVPLDRLLSGVEKPSRYLGCEFNSVHKDPGAVELRAVLVFPDLYEVGMAHLGTQILYGLGNGVEGVQVERAFLPGQDLLALLNEHRLPLPTLESRTPLRECDLLGVTLQSELTYTNILAVLDAAGIPVRARDRSGDDPVVLGGGPCAFNPEPLAGFFDLFFLGDAEEGWPDILELLREEARSRSDRRARIDALRQLPGIYCPGDFEPQYSPEGPMTGMRGGEVTCAVPSRIRSLDYPVPPSSFLVPFLSPIHDRINIEASRGCTRGCRFCHAGMVHRPVRERGAQSLVDAAGEAVRATGYGDLALTSLSIGDYGPLDEILETLMDTHAPDRVSMSLPSLRIGGLTPAVARQIQRVRRTGFTIAPEAGTARLRKVINKDFSDEEILQTARWVFEHGWESVKLYFMIGLPTETREDLEGIIRLVRTIAGDAPAKAKVTANISPFVPKPHTPFQWVAQDTEPELKEKLDLLIRSLRGGKVQVRWSRTDQSLLEGVLARGDRRVGPAIEAAWARGAVLDGWEEHFDWNIWKEAFDAEGIDPQWYANRERDTGETLPWDHVSCGVDRDYLISEYRKGLAGEVTPDCRETGCLGCGACRLHGAAQMPPMRTGTDVPEAPAREAAGPAEADRSARRIRMVYSKVGDLRYLGHLETARVFERACRRARVPVAFTGGYSPKPRITFALSLPTGTEALAEWLDIELTEAWSPEEVRESLNARLPRGMRIEEAWKVPLDVPALNGRVRAIVYEAVLPGPVEGLQGRIGELMGRDSVPVVRTRKGREKTLDLKDYLIHMAALDERRLTFTLAIRGEEGSARPQEVLQALGENGAGEAGDVRLTRTGLVFALQRDKAGGRPGWQRIWD